eukprot:scaffold7381_cov310-Pinguiococcus_pyrenoidosus.AAC.79
MCDANKISSSEWKISRSTASAFVGILHFANASEASEASFLLSGVDVVEETFYPTQLSELHIVTLEMPLHVADKGSLLLHGPALEEYRCSRIKLWELQHVFHPPCLIVRQASVRLRSAICRDVPLQVRHRDRKREGQLELPVAEARMRRLETLRIQIQHVGALVRLQRIGRCQPQLLEHRLKLGSSVSSLGLQKMQNLLSRAQEAPHDLADRCQNVKVQQREDRRCASSDCQLAIALSRPSIRAGRRLGAGCARSAEDLAQIAP